MRSHFIRIKYLDGFHLPYRTKRFDLLTVFHTVKYVLTGSILNEKTKAIDVYLFKDFLDSKAKCKVHK